jgi:hypothetical protein
MAHYVEKSQTSTDMCPTCEVALLSSDCSLVVVDHLGTQQPERWQISGTPGSFVNRCLGEARLLSNSVGWQFKVH